MAEVDNRLIVTETRSQLSMLSVLPQRCVTAPATIHWHEGIVAALAAADGLSPWCWTNVFVFAVATAR